MQNERLHIAVYGCVQGVGFRAACWREARALGLAGWVSNLPDGSVEIVAEGPPAALRALCEWCGHGPRFAQVDRVVTTPRPGPENLRSFDIRDSVTE